MSLCLASSMIHHDVAGAFQISRLEKGVLEISIVDNF
jgi:hypothetical protein